jgi:type I restriction enzyme S subunit
MRVGEWADLALGDVLTLQRGFDITKKEQRPGSVPVVSSSGIGSLHNDYKAPGPGVVIGRKGSLGTVFFIDQPFWPHDTTLWVKDFKGNDPFFCYLLLKTLRLEELDAGSSNPSLNRNHAHRLQVTCPQVGTQRRIAAVLSAFDELIEINERRIELLEDLARSIYREWFVRFRFPGHEDVDLVDSELGPIPEGWVVARLDDLAYVVVEGVHPSELEPDSRYVGLEHVPRRRTTLRDWGSMESVTSRKLLFSAGDTLFGKIRPYFHKVAWAPFGGAASSDTIVLRAHPDKSLPAFVNTVTSSDELVGQAVATSNGTKMPRADPKALLAYQLPLPGEDLLFQFERTVRPWIEWSAGMVEHNRQLATTRDLLLPRLVTGRLDISDVDLGVLTPTEAE